jgi:ribose-phosphate pyrophosphokinase
MASFEDDPPLLFALGSARRLGDGIAAALDVPVARHEERGFEDGEHKARPLESVRDRDVYVLDALHGEAGASPNDKLCRMLFFVGALRDASAGRITALVPYLCYARKDRRSKSRDPVTSRYVAALFEAVGVDRVVVMDVHNPAAFQNAFRVPTEHLEARALFVAWIAARVGGERVAVVSPDAGGFKRAERTREALARALGRPCELVFLEKKRSEGVVSGTGVVGDVDGAHAVVIDDLISSGGTMARAARALRERGARSVVAMATHGVFGAGASQALADPAIERIVVTNTVAVGGRLDGAAAAKLEVLDVAPLLAQAVHRMHAGGSVVELVEGPT